MRKNKFLIAGIAAGLFLIALKISPGILAQDFDFYGADLIAQESYKKISMDFRDASLKNILKVFSEQSGLNFIASQGIQDREVTLYLDNVPLQQALDKIMAANNLKYELEPGGNIFIVRELGRPEIELMTKIYPLKYARLKESRLEQEISAASVSSGGGIEDTVRSILTQNGKFVVDARTGSLIVTDIPTQFEVIDKVIAMLDVPTPQVMIEVEMLDVSKRTIDEMGFDTSKSLMSLSGAERQVRFPNFFADGLSLDSPTFSYGTLSSAVFTAILDFLKTDSRTKFLARPRILTLSNETAEIKITTSEAVGQNTVTSSSEGSATSSVEAERVDTGVSLKVTPQVDLYSGNVTMFIQPEVSEAKTGATFNNTVYKDPEKRSSTTTLMVKDGETIVVGGLIKTNEEVTEKKMPILGDIPFIGALFRHKSKDVEDRELIVFITPHIIRSKDAPALARVQSAAEHRFGSSREQGGFAKRSAQVDNMLQRWEN